jgi:hypothetical protein
MADVHNNDAEVNNDHNNERDSSKSEKRMNEKDVLRRVKLYFLNDEGKWDDKGTGHVSCEFVKVSVLFGDVAKLTASSSSNRSKKICVY